MNSLICVSDAQLSAKIDAAVKPLAKTLTCSAGELNGFHLDEVLLIADPQALATLRDRPRGALVVGVCAGPIGDAVECMARLPWLSQLVTPAVFDSLASVRRTLYGVTRQHPGLDVDTLAFLGGSRLHARRVLFYRSTDIERRLQKLEQFAGMVGARPRAVEHLHDIGNELLSNAFYDAPYEAGHLKEPPARQQSIELLPDMPCELVYGALEDELFVRVRDCFGALVRARMMEVLLRCARGSTSVSLDESRGGAGLGMWRVFRQSSRVVVSVTPGASTEMLVTVPMSGLARQNLRSWHFLFAPRPHDVAQMVSR